MAHGRCLQPKAIRQRPSPIETGLKPPLLRMGSRSSRRRDPGDERADLDGQLSCLPGLFLRRAQYQGRRSAGVARTSIDFSDGVRDFESVSHHPQAGTDRDG